MHKVLFFSYYFPPQGGPGVQRSLSFAKHLPKLGYDFSVITAEHPTNNRWAPNDAELINNLPKQVSITKVKLLESNCSKIQNTLSRWLNIRPQNLLEWRSRAIETGRLICRESKPSLILVTMSPFEGALAASTLSQEFEIPWIADLRDPWALDEMQIYPTGLHRYLTKRRMRSELSTASKIIMNTPHASKKILEEFPEFDPKKVTHITNGFEPYLRPKTDPRNKNKFVIVHTGSLHLEQGLQVERSRKIFETLGRTTKNVDFRSRSHYFLLQALEKLLAAHPKLVDKIQLSLVGKLTSTDRELLSNSPANKVVRTYGQLPHNQTIHIQNGANLLFLPMHTMPANSKSSIVPGKTYEYLATGTPILAAVPDGDTKEIIANSNLGIICEPSNPNEIAKAVLKSYQSWRDGEDTPEPNHEHISKFKRSSLSNKLKEIFDSVI